MSSVEEATEYGGQEARRKVFNHLDIEDGNSVSKSPRFLPKFLRASFSKLLKDKPKTEDRMLGVRRERDGYLRTWTVSTPVSRSPSINFDTGDHEVIHIPEPSSHVSATCTSHVSPEHSPTTGQFVAECLAKGLPIIPFNYSTAEILEKRRQSQRRKPAEILVTSERSEPQSPMERTPAPEWSEAEGADMAEDKSLEGLLTLARREMEQEAQLRKVRYIYIKLELHNFSDVTSRPDLRHHGLRSQQLPRSAEEAELRVRVRQESGRGGGGDGGPSRQEAEQQAEDQEARAASGELRGQDVATVLFQPPRGPWGRARLSDERARTARGLSGSVFGHELSSEGLCVTRGDTLHVPGPAHVILGA